MSAIQLAVGVEDLVLSRSPLGVEGRRHDRGSGGHGAFAVGVDILDVNVYSDSRRHSRRGGLALFRPRRAEHDAGISEGHLGVHNLAVGARAPRRSC